MKEPGDADDFERLLADTLDPGEIGLGAEEREEILSTAGFMQLLLQALDPGDIALDEDRRRELVARLTIGVKEEECTAWALGELEAGRRESFERRMAGDEGLKLEALAIRNFCNRAQLLLPPVPLPGWWEKRRLRRVFSGDRSGGRLPWLAGAAAVALALVLVRPPAPVAGPVPLASSETGRPAVTPGPAVLPGPLPLARPAVPGVPSDDPQTPTPAREVASAGQEMVFHPLVPAAWPEEPAWCFPDRPEPPPRVAAFTGRPFDPDELFVFRPGDRAGRPAWERQAATREIESDSILLASLDGGSPIQSPRWSPGGRELVAAAAAIARSNGVDADPDGDPDEEPETGANEVLPAAAPEAGSLVLAQSQPYLLSALLRGPVSGRPDLTGTDEGVWMSADFQTMDLNLPSGKGGIESDSWRIEAGLSWMLAPSWQAGVSVAGIDSRFEVPGFGSVDAEGAALSWSLDWRRDGYHAGLSHTFGAFDQDLRRASGGVMQPADQDATVQLLSFWFSREFEAGAWIHGPVAGVEGSWGSLEGYQEPFPGGIGMAGRDFGLMTSLIGWQLAGRCETAAGDWMPHAVLGWRHRAVLADAALAQGGPGGNFVVPPVLPERDSLLLEGGLRWVPPGGKLVFDAVSSTEWRDGGDSENSLFFKLRLQF